MTGVIALMLTSCGKSYIKNAKLANAEDSLSYAFGIVNYNALLADSLSLNPVLVAKAMVDGKEGKMLLQDAEARTFIMQFVNKRESARAEKEASLSKESYKDYIALNEAFLENNKGKSGVTVTESGLQYEVIQMGKGPKPTKENVVKVNYKGSTIDGAEFDSSYKRNEPATFPITGVIPGWSEALQLMPVGSKFKIYIPQSLAYGARGAGDVIKPYSTLIFEVELLEIVK